VSEKSRRSKAEEDLADAEAVFGALAHASRRHILLVLRFRGGEMTAGEIAGRFACRWPTTTRHLRILETAGLVRVEKRGRERVYRLEAKRLLGITSGWLKSVRSEVQPRDNASKGERDGKRDGQGKGKTP
jgi:DNA-binding transcriptional ArsR family regulator